MIYKATETRHHTLRDKRIIAYIEYGTPDGYPVFYAHGGPSSRLECAIFHEKAAEYGFRMIATDRPGMGESTYLPKRKLLDYPKDIVEIADALGIDKFGVMGWSGGGAHTTVCGYAIPERLKFNISLAGYTSFHELPGAVDLLKNKLDRKAIALSAKHPRLFTMFFGLMRLSAKYFPKSYCNALFKELCPADREIAYAPHFNDVFIKDQLEAFKQGNKGVATDAMVHYVDWGFHLKDIPCKLHVFHGDADYLVPLEYGQNIANKVPDCELHILKNEGHLFPVKYQELIFDTARSELEERKE